MSTIVWWVVGIVFVLVTVSVGALVAFRYSERALHRVTDRFNESITEPLHKPRRVQVRGRDHVCEFAVGSIFCSVCGQAGE